jgi:hypothetical protein
MKFIKLESPDSGSPLFVESELRGWVAPSNLIGVSGIQFPTGLTIAVKGTAEEVVAKLEERSCLTI